VLALAWAALGSASLFDLGVGRAVTKLVAERLGHSDDADLAKDVWSALSALAVIGLIGMVLVAVAAAPLGQLLAQRNPALQQESVRALRVLAIGIPFVTVGAGLRGNLEANQLFRAASFGRVFLGVATFVGPLLVTIWSVELPSLVAALVVVRALTATIFITNCWLILPYMRRPTFGRIEFHVLALGGWMALANGLATIFTYLDRFVIGGILTLTSLGYYAVAYEVVTKMWLVPSSVVGVLFPAFSASTVHAPDRAAVLYMKSSKVVFVALMPVTLIIAVLAKPAMGLWLGNDIAASTAPVLQVLALGVLINSVAFVSYCLLQASGRASVTALVQLVEVPFYVVGLVLLVERWGLLGAAAAWLARAVVDAAIQSYAALRRVDVHASAATGSASWLACCFALLVGSQWIGFSVTSDFAVRAALLVLVLGCYMVVTWRLALQRPQRDRLLRWGRRLGSQGS